MFRLSTFLCINIVRLWDKVSVYTRSISLKANGRDALWYFGPIVQRTSGNLGKLRNTRYVPSILCQDHLLTYQPVPVYDATAWFALGYRKKLPHNLDSLDSLPRWDKELTHNSLVTVLMTPGKYMSNGLPCIGFNLYAVVLLRSA